MNELNLGPQGVLLFLLLQKRRACLVGLAGARRSSSRWSSSLPVIRRNKVADAGPDNGAAVSRPGSGPRDYRRCLLADVAHRTRSFVHWQSERASYGLVVVRKCRFVAAVNHMALRTRAEAYLHGATCRKIFGRNDLDGKRQIGIPVTLLVGGLDRLGNVERCLHHGAIDPPIDRENAEDFHVVALRREDRVGED